MQSPGSRQAHFQGSVQNTLAAAEDVSRMSMCQALQKALGSNPGPTRKQPLKMEPTQLRHASQSGQVRLLRVLLVEILDNTRDSFVIGHATSLEEPCHSPTRFLRHRVEQRFEPDGVAE